MNKLFIFLFFVCTMSNAQVMGTPYMPVLQNNDKTRAALAAAGCASCTAYDAAADTALVPITAAEYTSILNTLTGASLRGINDFTSLTNLGTVNVMVQANSNFLILPNNSYVAAVAHITYQADVGSIAITCAATLSGATTCLTGTSASFTWTANEITYFAVKKPATHSGSNTFLGRISRSGLVRARFKGGGSMMYNQNQNLACGTAMTTAYTGTPAFQVVATTTRPW